MGGERRCRWRERFGDFKFFRAKRNWEKSTVLVVSAAAHGRRAVDDRRRCGERED
jgi:hypothetical protein